VTRARPPAGRRSHRRVATAKGRKLSSTRWLERQLNDPYVAAAREKGYRSRAAWKLIELDGRFRLLGRGKRVVDLGAAPGGWTQVAVERVGGRGADEGGGRVVAVDLAEMAPVPGAHLLRLDIRDEGAVERVRTALGGPADLVLSDMAAPATGHKGTDQIRVMALCEAALDLAERVLAPGGAFVAKMLKGGAERDLLARLKRSFRAVRHAKPPASRADSAEVYLVATGFRAKKGV